jgi:hypothetical protein
MSFDVLQSELIALSAEQRRKVIAFLITLEERSRPDYAAELARRIDDKSPGRWLTPEECEQELGLDSK